MFFLKDFLARHILKIVGKSKESHPSFESSEEKYVTDRNLL